MLPFRLNKACSLFASTGSTTMDRSIYFLPRQALLQWTDQLIFLPQWAAQCHFVPRWTPPQLGRSKFITLTAEFV